MTVIANFKAFVQRLSGQTAEQPAQTNTLRYSFSNEKRADFTQAELQKLQFILRENTKAFSEVLTELKVRSALAWALSNKEDPSTEPAFAEFSQLQKDKQRVQHHLRSLERLQNKVKRQLRA